MTIRIMGPDLSAKIAAGEVIERPASVVKELIENSLDAGASQIAVEIQGGGTRLIRVVDNGCGISPEEVALAFERFATSKLSTVDDLGRIATLGFRGEALPSVAAVSEVTMVTRGKDELAGTLIAIVDGNVLEKAKRGSPSGTTVTVRNLFRHFPARLKFLKSPATENGHVSQLVTNFSLAYPEVRFTLIIEGRTAFRSPGNGDLRDAIAAAYGIDAAKSMLEIGQNNEPQAVSARVSGYIGAPSLNRASRAYLTLFVNRRWVQNRMLSYAVEEAYEGLLLRGRHPLTAINITVPHQEVDVNVHPAKSEVRFQNERGVFSAVQKAVRSTLLAQSPMPTLDTLETRQPLEVTMPEPFLRPQAASEVGTSRPPVPSLPAPARSLPILRVVGQMANTYIVAEGPDGMYLIDQHAAHERILFEKIRMQREQKSVEIQGMLQPATVELTVRQQELLELQKEALSEYGFGIEHFGERTYLVRSVPAMLKGQDIARSLAELLDFLGEGEKSSQHDSIASSLACHSAVRAGQALSSEETVDLVRQLELASQPRTCPHGRPTMIHVSSSQLEKGFGRR